MTYTDSDEKGSTILGIEFAPLSIPLSRRLQTLITGFVVCALCSGWFFCLASLYMLIFTQWWLLVAVYWAWMYYDRETAHSGGRKSRFVQKLKIWKYGAEYFPTRLIKTAELPPNKNYLLCVYPHGILSISSFFNFCTEANNFYKLYPGVDPYRITLDLNFNSPLTREFYLSTGNCASSERSIVSLLNRKQSTACVLVVGGAAESLMAFPGTYKIMLSRRRGFIRLALQTGASLVPVISFGENDLYNQFSGKRLLRYQEYIRNLTTVAPVLLRGRGLFQYTFGIIPHRTPVNTVVGKPIDVPKVENPSRELINEYRDKFVEELKTLFETHKEEYDKQGKNVQLVIQ